MNTRRLVIVGFMGCGKTTVGEALGRALQCGFVDLDSFITERERRSPAQIITRDGEPSFRELETLTLRDILQDQTAKVIALGGGTWTIPANRTLIALHDCASVWLDPPFELCWQRILSAKTPRPLAPDEDTARKRFEKRRQDYALAERHLSINHNHTVAQVVEQILMQT